MAQIWRLQGDHRPSQVERRTAGQDSSGGRLRRKGRTLSRNFDFLRDVIPTAGEGNPVTHMPPLSSMLTMLVPTWCQTTLIQADLGAPIMTASPALIGLMAQHGCPQVGYQFDSSSWFGGDGLRRFALFARATRGLRRPSWDAYS
jgi:hypothetical protein